MLCFLHSKNIILNRVFFSLSKGLRFSSKAKTFLVSNSKSCCSTFKGKRKTKHKNQTPLPGPACSGQWSHSSSHATAPRTKLSVASQSLQVHRLLPLFSPPAFVFNQIHSFASSTAFCASNLHLILLQYSGATGDLGSCAEQQRRPSSADGTRAPFS